MEGTHIIASFFECRNKKALVEKEFLEKNLVQLTQKSGLKIVNRCFYKFLNAGITGVILISESHISIHTWPERNFSLSVDIYVCNLSKNNQKKAENIYNGLIKLFSPKRVKKTVFKRD